MIKGSLIDDLRGIADRKNDLVYASIVLQMVAALIAIDDALYQQQDDMIETITEILRKPR